MKAAIAVFLWFALMPSVANAAGSGDGIGRVESEAGEISTEVWVTDDGTVVEPAATGGGSSRSPRAFRYVYEPLPTWSSEQGGPFCDAGGGAPGWKFKVTMMSGGVLVGEPSYICVAFPDPNDQAAPPAPPVLAAPPTVTASVGAWSVSGTATRSGYRFDFGDGAAGRSASDVGGSEADPPARHTYETKGPYVLSVSSTWTATFTLTGPNLSVALPVDVGTVAVTTTRDYRVVEIRGVLVG